jgi:hypothetical protein
MIFPGEGGKQLSLEIVLLYLWHLGFYDYAVEVFVKTVKKKV